MDWEERAADFVVRAAAHFTESAPTMVNYGATKGAQFTLEGRRVEILAGGTFAIEASVSLPGFPVQAAITYAPEGLYARTKLMEEGCAHAVAGVRAFDEKFLVLGAEASQILENLGSEGLTALVEAGDLWPDLKTFKFASRQLQQYLHIRASPSVEHVERADEGARDLEQTIRAVDATVELTLRLERAWSTPS